MSADIQKLRRLCGLLEDLGANSLGNNLHFAISEIERLRAAQVGADAGAAGYVNLYRADDGTVEMGATDLYETVEEARDFDASEFAEHLGVFAVVPVAAVGAPVVAEAQRDIP